MIENIKIEDQLVELRLEGELMPSELIKNFLCCHELLFISLEDANKYLNQIRILECSELIKTEMLPNDQVYLRVTLTRKGFIALAGMIHTTCILEPDNENLKRTQSIITTLNIVRYGIN